MFTSVRCGVRGSSLNGKKRGFHTLFNREKFWAKENVPVYGMFIGAGAISFQIGVLFPWHEVISKQIDEIEESIAKLHGINEQIQTKLDKLIIIQTQLQECELELSKKETLLSRIEQIPSQK